MAEILSTSGFSILIDDEDFEEVSAYSWGTIRKGPNIYAKCNKQTWREYMHRFIMNAQFGDEIDHRDGNGLNNQKSNLRFCTRMENQRNQRKRLDRPGITSIYKGVVKYPSGRFNAKIIVRGAIINLGTFDTELEAANAYDKMAQERFGEFARLNNA